MRRLNILFSVVACLLVVLTSCKDEEIRMESPSITLSAPGHPAADDAIQISVLEASTAIVIDYTVTTSSRIQQFVQIVDGVEKTIPEAGGLEEYSGQLMLNVPYESKTVVVQFEVTDENDLAATETISINIVAAVSSGEIGGISWEVDGLFDGSILKLYDADSRFGIKANPLPMYFFDFSAGSAVPHPTYSRKDGANIRETTGEPSTEQIPPQKTQSWKAPLKDVRYASSVVKIEDSDFAAGISIFVRRFWTHDGNTDGHDKYGRFNHKLCRLWSGGGINPYYQYDRLLMEQSPVNAAKYWNGATYHTPFVRTWVLDEARYIASSELDAADASVQLRRNGVLVAELLNTVSRSTEKPQEWSELAIDQVVNLSEVPEGFAVYYDMLVVDDSEQRVMLTNNPDLSLATEKEYLPAKVWVDDEIQVYLRKGTFESFQGKYLCIQDENGDQIGEGIPLQ